MGKREELIELKNKSGMNWKQFSEYYEIPYRTIQDIFLTRWTIHVPEMSI